MFYIALYRALLHRVVWYCIAFHCIVMVWQGMVLYSMVYCCIVLCCNVVYCFGLELTALNWEILPTDGAFNIRSPDTSDTSESRLPLVVPKVSKGLHFLLLLWKMAYRNRWFTWVYLVAW